VVLLVGFTDQYTLDPMPADELIWTGDVSKPAGGSVVTHSPIIPTGYTNLAFTTEILALSGGSVTWGAKINDASDPDSNPANSPEGSSFFQLTPLENSTLIGSGIPGSMTAWIDQQRDFTFEAATDSATEIGVNKYGQDPAVYPPSIYGPATVSRANHVVFTHSGAASTVRINLYGKPRGTRLTVPIPAGTIEGDRVVVILLFQLPYGGPEAYGINNTLIPVLRNQPVLNSSLPPSAYRRRDGSFAPFISKQWWADYTHNHDFTGAFGSNATLDGSGEFLPKEYEGGVILIPADPDNGIPFAYQQRFHGDQQTNTNGLLFSHSEFGSSRGAGSGSCVVMGSTRYRTPRLPAGWVDGDPVPAPVNEYTFYLEGGRLNADATAHMTALTFTLRNEVGTENYGAPYRRGNSDPNFTAVGSLLNEEGDDIYVSVNAYNQPNPGEINHFPTPPELHYLPADPTDLIVTAYTYSGSQAWGNPLAEITDTFESDPSNTKIISLGLRGWQVAPTSPLGWDPPFPFANNPFPYIPGDSDTGATVTGNAPLDSAGRHWLEVDYDDSFWDTPVLKTNSYDGYADETYCSPPTVNPNGWWAHYAFPRSELFAFRMMVNVESDGYIFREGHYQGRFSHAVGFTLFGSGGVYTPLPQYGINSFPRFAAIDNGYEGRLGQDFPKFQNGWITNYPYSRWVGYSGFGVPFDFGPQIICGFFSNYAPPHTWPTNPSGLNIRLSFTKTLYDEARISGLIDRNAPPGDPPLINLSSVREVVTGPVNAEPWNLGREIWVQQAGGRALSQELYDYAFDQVPPFLPVPSGAAMNGTPFFGAPDVSFSYGTGFRFVWRDAGPGRLQFSNRASSISFAG